MSCEMMCISIKAVLGKMYLLVISMKRRRQRIARFQCFLEPYSSNYEAG